MLFERLISFLETLDPDKFYLDSVVADWEETEDGLCGTVCCALGWTPAIFPEEVKWVEKETSIGGKIIQLCHIKTGSRQYDMIAFHLFGIDPGVALDLFAPGDLTEIHPLLGYQVASVKAKTFAKTLRKFLSLIDSGELRPDGTLPVSA